MGFLKFSLFVIISWGILIRSSYQLKTSQTQVLKQLRKHLEYPSALQVWDSYYGDFCSISSSVHMSITCEDNSVSELKIMGDKVVKDSDFDGVSIPNKTLSESFSIDSLVTTLTRLSGLKFLSLVSLGIWGSLPDKIHRLSDLKVLDLSSNFLFGSVPASMSIMVRLEIFTLDDNYFNGTVPDWFDEFSNLTIFSLKNNRFNGEFPYSICRIGTLTDVALSRNELSGKLPDMSALTSLYMLDLRENHLDSELPKMPKGLVTALLSKNSFSGKIPEQFGELHQLQHLDLSFNELSGTPTPALFSLPNISYLNLASNILSASFYDDLSCGIKLGFVDISNNRFVGELPSCLGSTSGNRVVKVDGNCLSIDGSHQHNESFCEEADVGQKESRPRAIGIVIAAIIGAVVLITLLTYASLALYRRYHSRQTFEEHVLPKVGQDNPLNAVPSEILTNARLISQTAKLATKGAPLCRTFSLEELKEATKNFDSSTLIGEGSTGKLYKGKLETGAYIAIRAVALKKCSTQNLKVRLDMLSKLHHPHLVVLLGHCIDDTGQDNNTANKVYLVYEYMHGGSYREKLSESSPEICLKWSDRLAVLIGVAKAVLFLHAGVIPGCLRNRLKTNNILLDEHRIAKLSDYGMSIITDDIEKLEAKAEGPKSSYKRNLEDDVYNFGFILLESLVGPIVRGKGEAFLLNEMASFGSQDGRKRIVDPIVLTTCSQESLSIVIAITNKCISSDPVTRPSLEDVLWNLQYAAQVQAAADTEQRSDSTSQS